MRVPGTLSARIILGFAVLIVTYGAISANTMFNMDRLYREVRTIRGGYLGVALKSIHLAERQKALLEYLKDELRDEERVHNVTGRLRSARATRTKLLREIEELASEVTGLPEYHKRAFAETVKQLAQVREMVNQTDVHYENLLAAPPIAGTVRERVDPAAAQLAIESLTWLQSHEGRINRKVQDLRTRQDMRLTRSATLLDQESRKLRLLTFAFGAGAAVIGIAVILMATLTLRPLRRLRFAAQRIAQGDYASRIEVQGPPEVADLAREFNAMGAAVEERERELVQSERLSAIGKMSAAITHEVRNPLSSISLNTELLEDELSGLPESETGEARNLCRAISREVDRLTEITETYLQFARLPKPRRVRENLNGIIDSLLEFEREQLTSRGVELEVDLAPDLPAVAVDENQIRQALLNLLRNAADAVHDMGGGRVSVSTRRAVDGRSVEILVQDDGPGIAEDLLGKLFEPFFSTKDVGTGLGLALTRQIIKEHEGTIRVDSRPGVGASFVISLPTAEPTEPSGDA